MTRVSLSRCLIAWTCLMTSAAFAQRGYTASTRATITGGGGDRGKCTIEVEVDDAAEVEVVGDSARVRTLAGQPATIRRMQCTSAIPRNPNDFQFRGIDGRGQVNLVQDPRNNRGIAVVRIVDPKGGSEGYTFDLEWRGGSDAYGNDGRYNNGRYNDRYNDRRGDRYDDRRNDRYDNRVNGGVGRISCSSDDGRRTYCDADTRDGVRMLRQRSDAPCRQGSTWGYDRRGIWVDRGCRADFQTGR